MLDLEGNLEALERGEECPCEGGGCSVEEELASDALLARGVFSLEATVVAFALDAGLHLVADDEDGLCGGEEATAGLLVGGWH